MSVTEIIRTPDPVSDPTVKQYTLRVMRRTVLENPEISFIRDKKRLYAVEEKIITCECITKAQVEAHV